MDIKSFVDVIFDFPIKGKNVLDMSRLLSSTEAFSAAGGWFIDMARSNNISHIVAIETKGLIWGSIVSFETNLPLHLARKPLLLPGNIVKKQFSSRNRPYSLSMSGNAIISGNVMVVDDTIASGATFGAVGEMLTDYWNIPPCNQYHTALIYSGTMPGKQVLIDKGYNVNTLVRITD